MVTGVRRDAPHEGKETADRSRAVMGGKVLLSQVVAREGRGTSRAAHPRMCTAVAGADAGVRSNGRIHAGSVTDVSDRRREPRLRPTRPAGSFKIEGMSNRSRPTQAKRIREKALQEKRQQKATRRQDAKDRRDQRAPGAAEGEDPDIAGIVLGPQPHPYLEPDELDPDEEV